MPSTQHERSTDKAFIAAFERGDVPASEFHHAAHVRLALAYLTDSRSVAEATERMAASLKAFAAAAGVPQKFHHTMTVFWMEMVAQLLDPQLRGPRGRPPSRRLLSADRRHFRFRRASALAGL
jgi:hypothetical protein